MEGIMMEGNTEMEDINMEVDLNMEALILGDYLDISKFQLKNANNISVIYINKFILTKYISNIYFFFIIIVYIKKTRMTTFIKVKLKRSDGQMNKQI